jgi:GTP:adenosylcobinamide-phosphate guanylyltransferase
MDVVILAGGETPAALAETLGTSTPDERALIEISGRPCIAYLLDSLRMVNGVGALVCVGGPRTLAWLAEFAPEVLRVEAKATLVENLLTGAACATSPQILLCTVDIPLVTAQTWNEFLKHVRENDLEAAYPIVRRASVERMFPEGKRTFATLAEGIFTGGNAFVLPRARLSEIQTVIDAAYRARKNPLAIAHLLGLGFVFKALTKRLTILDLERKMSQVLKCRAGGIEMNDASIAFDVDKPSDFELAQKILKENIS